MRPLQARILRWEDSYHNQHLNLLMFGSVYNIETYIDQKPDFYLTQERIYDLITAIMYFEIDESTVLDEKEFSPHQIMAKEVFDVKYYRENQLVDLIVN